MKKIVKKKMPFKGNDIVRLKIIPTLSDFHVGVGNQSNDPRSVWVTCKIAGHTFHGYPSTEDLFKVGEGTEV